MLDRKAVLQKSLAFAAALLIPYPLTDGVQTKFVAATRGASSAAVKTTKGEGSIVSNLV